VLAVETRRCASAGPRAVAIAVLAASAALATAFGFSRFLRHREEKVSRQLPTPEAWVLETLDESADTRAEGRKLFLSSCAHCHGADAAGDEGPDLHGIQVSNRYISNTILRGIKGEMPSFRKKLGGVEIKRLTAYLNSLR
jgi:mono/diheme cytochrome c family protein